MSLLLALALAVDPAAVVVGAELASPRQPQLAVGDDGVIHLVFGDGTRLYYTHSKGVAPLRFARPVKVADVPNMPLGMRRGPRVAAAGNTIVVTAIGGPKGKGRDGDLFAWRSTDVGKTWKGPARVNDAEASAREGLHAMAASPDGTFACTWLDLRTRRTTLQVSTSKDGQKWSSNVLAYESPSGSICECCHPSLVYDENKSLHLFWRNSIDGFRDMYRSVSTDGGKSFAAALKLGIGSWKLNACPMDGGSIAIHEGKALTAWRREHVVYATFGDDEKEVRLGDGEQPAVAALDSGALVVWIKRRPGDLLLQREMDAKPTRLATDAADPVAASSSDGKHAIIAWEGKANGRAAIFVQSIGKRGDS